MGRLRGLGITRAFVLTSTRLGAQEETMNEDTLKGQWTQIKGRVREQWGKLTDDDITRIEGKSEQLVGRLQERYGWAKEDAQREVDDWMRTQSSV